MNNTDISALVNGGKIVSTAEFRSAIAEAREFVWDGKTQKAKGITYNFEFNGVPATYTKKLDDSADLDAVRKTFPARGSMIVVEFVPEPCMGAKAQRGTYRLRVEILGVFVASPLGKAA